MDGMIIDCFAGGGGASVGIEMALGRHVDIAINHDPEAIRMHKVNHPSTLHLTEDIFKADLKKYVAGRKVALMWASPDCTSHSKAKGGQPRKKGLRILPWAVYKHAKAILPEVIIMENVEEIQQWGPLDEKGHPIKERQGEDYKKFIVAMKTLGYAFDSRELVAADYGAPTTRKRWYAIFRRDGKSIVWPEQTHFKNSEPHHQDTSVYSQKSNSGQMFASCCQRLVSPPIIRRTTAATHSAVCVRILKSVKMTESGCSDIHSARILQIRFTDIVQRTTCVKKSKK